MTEAEEILHTLASTLYCMGQDWVKGDGSAEKVEPMADEALAALSVLVEGCIGDEWPEDAGEGSIMWYQTLGHNKAVRKIHDNFKKAGLL